ncbi:hypothetical protein BDP27DRAFT_1207583, partial [Rhodocollybia butyracea]
MSALWEEALSPFANVIGTNYAPSEAELASLQSLLVEPSSDLDQLEIEIVQAQSVLNALFSKQKRIQKYVEAHRALMSPVRRIPSETLASIFAWCLPTERNAVRSLAEAPLLLTTICRDWRGITLDTPQLWKSLHVYLPPDMSDYALFERIKGITRWLERSGSLPVSISL